MILEKNRFRITIFFFRKDRNLVNLSITKTSFVQLQKHNLSRLYFKLLDLRCEMTNTSSERVLGHGKNKGRLFNNGKKRVKLHLIGQK